MHNESQLMWQKGYTHAIKKWGSYQHVHSGLSYFLRHIHSIYV